MGPPPHCLQAQSLQADSLRRQHPFSSFAGRKHPICVHNTEHTTQKQNASGKIKTLQK
jgi:hypothetical protein